MDGWNYFALISLVFLMFAIIIWVTSSRYKLLDCIKKKHCGYVFFGVTIFLSVITLIGFVGHWIIMFSNGDSVVKQSAGIFGDQINGISNETNKALSSLNLARLDTPQMKQFPLGAKIIVDIKSSMSPNNYEAVSAGLSDNIRLATASSTKTFLNTLESEYCLSEYTVIFDELNAKMNSFKSWNTDAGKALEELYREMKIILNSKMSGAADRIKEEKDTIESHSNAIKAVLGKFVSSFTTAETAASSASNPGAKEDSSTSQLCSAIMIVLQVVVLLISVPFSAWFFLTSNQKQWARTATTIFFFALIATILLSLGVLIILAATTPNGCSSNQSSSVISINFDFPLPFFHSTVQKNGNQAFTECTSSRTKIFTAPNDKIYILKSALMESYRNMWNEKIKTFEGKIKLKSFKHKDFVKNMNDLIEKLISAKDSCTNHVADIDTYLTRLQQISNDTTSIYTEFTRIHTNFRDTAIGEIEKGISAMKTTIQTEIDIIDNSIKKLDFDCLTVKTALKKEKSKCKEQEVYPFVGWIMVIVFSSATSLFLSLLLSSMIAKETKKDKTDEETKQSSATELAKESSNVQLNKVTSTVSAKAELSTNPIELWASLISSANFDNVLTAFDESLLNFKPPNATFKASDANKALNCNKNYQCIDESRVVLKNNKNEYINASWVRVPNSKTPYILTQNPLAETVADFWAMCYAEKVKCIVSFCSPDGGLAKCAPYFPTDVKEAKYMDYEVKVGEPKKDVIRDTIVRKLQVLDKSKHGGWPLIISHVTILWWPVDNKDERMNVPKDAQPAIQLHRYAKNLYPHVSPVCVVSGEGVGRSAAFVLLDYAIIRLQQGARMVEIVKEFRGMRNMALENKTQYEVLHVLLLEYFADCGYIQADTCEKFKKNYTDQHFPPPEPKQ